MLSSFLFSAERALSSLATPNGLEVLENWPFPLFLTPSLLSISVLSIVLWFFGKHSKKTPPTAPYALPLLGHAVLFLKDPEKLASVLA
jgi:hypothetical protein